VTISSSAADAVAGYTYGMYPTTATPVYPVNPACGTQGSGLRSLCVDSAAASASVVVTPIDETSRIAVQAFDMAGNVSSASKSFYARVDATAVKAGHSWPTDAGVSNPTAPCPQAAAVADTASSSVMNMSLSGSVCWQSSASFPPPAGSTATPNVLNFPGTTHTSRTASSPIDTSKSFTVGAWLRPATVSSAGTAQTAIVQHGVNEEMFYLQNSNGAWWFCMPFADTAVWKGDCVAGPPVVANQWTFVVGVFDAVNRQMRIYVSTDGSGSTPLTETHQANPYVPGGQLELGLDQINGSVRQWTGQILDPFVFQGTMSSSLFAYLGKKRMAPSQVPIS
jgi:hypothetical protein